LARVESLRCRVAGYAYLRRFEQVLADIERDDYVLRARYPERAGREAEASAWALWMALACRQSSPARSPSSDLTGLAGEP
jgi:hypothetical protein